MRRRTEIWILVTLFVATVGLLAFQGDRCPYALGQWLAGPGRFTASIGNGMTVIGYAAFALAAVLVARLVWLL